MKKIPTSLLVVAARITDRAGRVLLQQGLPGKRHAGLWEFPGGKVEAGETARDALVREVAEELGVILDWCELTPIGFVDDAGSGDHPPLVLILYNCPVWRGRPEARDGQVWGWFAPAELASLALAPLDRTLVARCIDGEPV